MIPTSYTIVVATTLGALETKVRELMGKEWYPFGNLVAIVDCGEFAQAMVRYRKLYGEAKEQ